MGKVCAFLGNNYDKFGIIEFGHPTPVGLKARIRQEIINLIENKDVDTFLVGEIGGYEKDAYDVVLSVQKEYPKIRIYIENTDFIITYNKYKRRAYEFYQATKAEGVKVIKLANEY